MAAGWVQRVAVSEGDGVAARAPRSPNHRQCFERVPPALCRQIVSLAFCRPRAVISDGLLSRLRPLHAQQLIVTVADI